MLVDAGQLPFECVKSNVLPKFPGNHNVTNNEKAKSPPGNKKSKSPHGKNGKSCGNMNLPEVAKKEKRTVDSSDNTSDDVTARKETSRVKFANVDKQRNDSPDSRRYRQHKEHQNIHDVSNALANADFAPYNLVVPKVLNVGHQAYRTENQEKFWSTTRDEEKIGCKSIEESGETLP